MTDDHKSIEDDTMLPNRPCVRWADVPAVSTAWDLIHCHTSPGGFGVPSTFATQCPLFLRKDDHQKHAWKSRPCHGEQDYHESLGQRNSG